MGELVRQQAAAGGVEVSVHVGALAQAVVARLMVFQTEMRHVVAQTDEEVVMMVVANAKKRAGFHPDNAQVLIESQFEVEAPLRLKDFARANGIGGFTDLAANLRGWVTGRQTKRVRKKAVAQQDADLVAPAGVGSGQPVA